MMWIKGPQPLDDGCWHHIAGVSDLAVTTLYVDGVEVRSSDAKTPYRLVGEELRIGKHGDLGTGTAARARPFKGLMDEVAIWNRTLSQEEIADVMEATQKADPIVEDRSAEMNQIADCLLQGDLDGAGKILEKIEGLGTDEWNSFRQSAEEVLRMPGIVWQAYSSLAGKTTDVYLNSGTKNLYIKAVTDDKVEAEIRIVRGGQVVASAEQNFSYDELSPRDKLVRLGKEQTPELNIMRGILACCAGVPEKAGPYFERAGNALGKTLIERMESNRVAGAVGRFSP
jgi:hypothetical protein